jgi:hypothetical protein
MLQHLTRAWFRIATSPERLRSRIASLQHAARSATPAIQGTRFAELAELYMRAGEVDQALTCYGYGIDAFLRTDQFDSAAALCRTVIANVPHVVRTHCTLAFLSLRQGQLSSAAHAIAAYAEASRREGQETFAIARLRMMANATDDAEVRRLLGHHLVALGDPRGAADLLAVRTEEHGGARPPPLENQWARWNRLLRVAITGPVERPDEYTA